MTRYKADHVCADQRILTYLQGDGDKTVKAIAAALHINQDTVRVQLKNLQNAGMVRIEYILCLVITLTDEGATWRPAAEPEPVETWPCGHPKAASTAFCMTCHNEQRRIACKSNKWLPTLRVQMR